MSRGVPPPGIGDELPHLNLDEEGSERMWFHAKGIEEESWRFPMKTLEKATLEIVRQRRNQIQQHRYDG